MKKFKKIALIAIVLVFIMSISMQTITAQDAKKPVTLKVIWWGTQDRVDKTLKVIEMFQKENPGIVIEPIYTGWQDYFEKLATLIAGNDIPDIVQMTIQNLPQYAEKNLLEDLSKVASLDLSGIDQSALDTGKYNGVLYSVNLGVNAPCLVYNKALFDKAGVGYPNEKWTWKDFEKNALTLSKKLNMPGFFNMALDYNDFEIYIREKGESIYSKDTKTVGFKAETAAEFLEMALRMQKSGAMEHIKVSIEKRGNDENSSYAKEQSAMRFLWSNKVPSVFKVLQKDSELAVYPGPNNNQGIFIKPALSFCIAKNSKVKDEAGKFITYFVKNIEANKVLKGERGIPVFASVRAALKDGLDSQSKKIYDYLDFVAKFNTRALDPQFPPTDRECKRTIQSVFEEVLYEKISVKDGAKKLVTEMNVILSK